MAAVLPFMIGGLVGGLASKALSPKPQAAAPAVQIPRQVQVRTNTAASDALLSRKGSRANQRTGPRGVEAGGGKTKLGQ